MGLFRRKRDDGAGVCEDDGGGGDAWEIETVLFPPLFIRVVTIFGWFTLLFRPYLKRVQFYIRVPAVIVLCLEYAALTLHHQSISTVFKDLFRFSTVSTKLDVFSFSNVSAKLWNSTITYLSGTVFLKTSDGAALMHFASMDLVAGSLICNDFYAEYHVTLLSRAVVSLVLLVAWCSGPLGALCYLAARTTVLHRNKLAKIDDPRIKTPSEEMSDKLTDAIPSPRPLIDWLPSMCRRLVYLFFSILGLTSLLVSLVLYFVVFTPLCLAYWTLTLHWPFERAVQDNIWPFKGVVVLTGRMRLFWTLTAKRHWFLRRVLFWFPYVLEFSYFAEFLPFSDTLYPYVDAIANEFGPVFPFGNGIGFSSHKDVKAIIEDPKMFKGQQSLGWKSSTAQCIFAAHTPVFRPQSHSQDYMVREARRIVREWGKHITPDLIKTERHNLDAHLPRRPADGSMIDGAVLESTFPMAWFHLLTGGKMTKEERAEIPGIIHNIGPFLPDWINFLGLGWLLERTGMHGYKVMRDALLRHPTTDPLKDAVALAKGFGWESGETMRFLAMSFVIPIITPSILTRIIVEMMYDERDGRRNVKLYEQDKVKFIKEVTRRTRSVPIVNTLAHEKMKVKIGGKSVELPEGTPLHASIVNAHRDGMVFSNPLEFNPGRTDLDKLLTWNGTESKIMDDEENLRKSQEADGVNATPAASRSWSETLDGQFPIGDHPPRRCPGHAISIMLIQEMVDRYKPLAEELQREIPLITEKRMKDIQSKQSFYTKLLLFGSKMKGKTWNANFPRASDVLHPIDAVQKDLGSMMISTGDTAPVYDEDESLDPLVPAVKFLLQTCLAPVRDPFEEWRSPDEAVGWRIKAFESMFPPPNVEYKEFSSNAMLSQLAFGGMVCLRTKKVLEYKNQEGHRYAEEVVAKNAPEDAIYVNECIMLGDYAVRKGFHEYGAAAFFDKNYNIVGIYTEFDKQMNGAPEPEATPTRGWVHAVWVWKVSSIFLVTAIDHLVKTHLVESNALVFASRKHLSPKHPLRAFLKIFTFRTISINRDAFATLTVPKGLIERIWAFEGEGLQNMLRDARGAYEFVLFKDLIHESMKNLGDAYPADSDVRDYWKHVHQLVTGILDAEYRNINEMNRDKQLLAFLTELSEGMNIGWLIKKNGNFEFGDVVNVLASLICTVTAFHEHVGQVSDYFANPSFAGTTLRRGMEIDTIQTYSMLVALVSLTGLRVPRLDADWDRLLTHNRSSEESIKAFDKFREGLRKLSVKVDERNSRIEERNEQDTAISTRGFFLQSFNPRNLECSVSV